MSAAPTPYSSLIVRPMLSILSRSEFTVHVRLHSALEWCLRVGSDDWLRPNSVGRWKVSAWLPFAPQLQALSAHEWWGGAVYQLLVVTILLLPQSPECAG